MFVKSATDLSGRAVANFPLISGKFGEDQQSIYTSSFVGVDIPSNFEAGDFCGVYDEYGTIVYSGIINQIQGNTIESRAMLSLFDFEWFLKPITGVDPNYYAEEQIKFIVDTGLTDSGVVAQGIKADMTITDATQTVAGKLYAHNSVIENWPSTNIAKFMLDTQNAWGCHYYFTLPYAPGNLALTISQATHAKEVIGDNTTAVFNINAGEEQSPDNVLRVWVWNGSGGNFWTYTLLKDGTYTQTPPGDASLLFSKMRVKTQRLVTADWDFQNTVQMLMPPLIYNSNISFDMLLENNLYDFYDWQLGMPMEVWKEGRYYQTVYTAWEMEFADGQPASIVHITCGTARSKLTEVLNDRK